MGRLGSLVVHFVKLWAHQVVEVGGELLHGSLIPLLRCELERPAAVHFTHQVIALGVVDAIVFPTLDDLILELASFLTGLDAALLLKVASDQFCEDDSFRWISHD